MTTTSFRRPIPRMSHVAAMILSAALLPGSAAAQSSPTQTIDFDRPESWAMKYFASVSIPTQLGPPEIRKAWSVDLGLELALIPHLSANQRRVGFNGFKEEELNRSPVMARPRIRLGLPGGFGLDVSWIPPIEVEGVESNLWTVGLDRALYQGERWSLGARAFAQTGESEGDFTCSADVASFPPGSAENIWGCEAPSSDRISLDYRGLAVTGGFRLDPEGVRTVTFGAGVTSMDLVSEVDAVTYGFHDQTRLKTDGSTTFYTLGYSQLVRDWGGISVEAFYSPLDVRRPGKALENDPLFTVRMLFNFRFDHQRRKADPS